MEEAFSVFEEEKEEIKKNNLDDEILDSDEERDIIEYDAGNDIISSDEEDEDNKNIFNSNNSEVIDLSSDESDDGGDSNLELMKDQEKNEIKEEGDNELFNGKRYNSYVTYWKIRKTYPGCGRRLIQKYLLPLDKLIRK